MLRKFIRKPSIKKSISARTSPKRIVKNTLGLKVPKGYGWITSPKKYAYNKVYYKTSISIFDIFKKLFK
mgnify:CR=1 FL=1